jgi:hypothetical protein
MPLEPIWVVFVTVVLIGCLILGLRAFGAGTGAAESSPPILVLDDAGQSASRLSTCRYTRRWSWCG